MKKSTKMAGVVWWGERRKKVLLLGCVLVEGFRCRIVGNWQAIAQTESFGANELAWDEQVQGDIERWLRRGFS